MERSPLPAVLPANALGGDSHRKRHNNMSSNSRTMEIFAKVRLGCREIVFFLGGGRISDKEGSRSWKFINISASKNVPQLNNSEEKND